LVWYLFASADYLLTKLQAPIYVDFFAVPVVDYFSTRPNWATAIWAIGAWAGLLGSLMLICCIKGALGTLGLAAFAMCGATLYFLVLSDPVMPAVTGPAGTYVMLGIALTSIPGLVCRVDG
jgi:hypothetical protein